MTHTGSVQLIVAATAVLMTTAAIAYAEQVNDYPTSARAEYVFGCLKANGERRQADRHSQKEMAQRGEAFCIRIEEQNRQRGE